MKIQALADFMVTGHPLFVKEEIYVVSDSLGQALISSGVAIEAKKEEKMKLKK